MKGLFFPFSKKYSHLSEHVWHRIALVAYWIIIPLSLAAIWFFLQAPQANAWNNCIQRQIELAPSILPGSVVANCSDFRADTKFNLLLAVLGTLILSYLIQALYYKVLLYIVLGKKKD